MLAIAGGSRAVRRQRIRQFFSENSHQKNGLPHECKPFCVNPTLFLPTTRWRVWIHIHKSLNAGTSEKETEPLALCQGFSSDFISRNCLIFNKMVGERGFEPPTPWSRTWGQGADVVNIQSFEWCFNRLSLARSRQFGRNVNPPIATLARVSFHLGESDPGSAWRLRDNFRIADH